MLPALLPCLPGHNNSADQLQIFDEPGIGDTVNFRSLSCNPFHCNDEKLIFLFFITAKLTRSKISKYYLLYSKLCTV
jgi:hypothetical protein